MFTKLLAVKDIKKFTSGELLGLVENWTKAHGRTPAYQRDTPYLTPEEKYERLLSIIIIRIDKQELKLDSPKLSSRFDKIKEFPNQIEKENADILAAGLKFLVDNGYKPGLIYKNQRTAAEAAEHQLACQIDRMLNDARKYHRPYPKFKQTEQLSDWQRLLNAPTFTDKFGAEYIQKLQKYISVHQHLPERSDTDALEDDLHSFIDRAHTEKFSDRELQETFLELLKTTPNRRQKYNAEMLNYYIEFWHNHGRKPYKSTKPREQLTAARIKEHEAAIWWEHKSNIILSTADQQRYQQLLAEINWQKEVRKKMPVKTKPRHLDTRKATMEQLIPQERGAREIIKHKNYLQIGTALLGGFEIDETNRFNLDGWNAPNKTAKHLHINEENIIYKKELPLILGYTLAANIKDSYQLIISHTNLDMQKPNPETEPENPKIHRSDYTSYTLNEVEAELYLLAQKTGWGEKLISAYTAAVKKPADLAAARNLNNILQEIKKQYNQNIFTMHCLVLEKNYGRIADILRKTPISPENRQAITKALSALAFIKTSAIYDLPKTYAEVSLRWMYAPQNPLDRQNAIRVICKTLRDISPETQKLLQEIIREVDQELLSSYSM